MSVPFDFVRSHGLGNDYLVMDPARLGFELTPDRIRLICDRNKGVGSDGILLLAPVGAISNREGQGPSKPVAAESRSYKAEAVADFAVRIYNPDGSEAEKSGNGLRIFARFLYNHGYTTKKKFAVHTLGGIANVELLADGVRVEMGRAVIDRKLTKLEVAGQMLSVTSLSVGNPHCVTIVDDLAKVNLDKLGPLIECHKAFPNRTNVQFAQVIDRVKVRALIWERGAGHTLASGSSSCAVAAACYDTGLVDGRVTVHMEGGDLTIEVSNDLDLVMTGPVEEICTGNFSTDLRWRLQ